MDLVKGQCVIAYVCKHGCMAMNTWIYCLHVIASRYLSHLGTYEDQHIFIIHKPWPVFQRCLPLGLNPLFVFNAM